MAVNPSVNDLRSLATLRILSSEYHTFRESFIASTGTDPNGLQLECDGESRIRDLTQGAKVEVYLSTKGDHDSRVTRAVEILMDEIGEDQLSMALFRQVLLDAFIVLKCKRCKTIHMPNQLEGPCWKCGYVDGQPGEPGEFYSASDSPEAWFADVPLGDGETLQVGYDRENTTYIAARFDSRGAYVADSGVGGGPYELSTLESLISAFNTTNCPITLGSVPGLLEDLRKAKEG